MANFLLDFPSTLTAIWKQQTKNKITIYSYILQL
jgi:hypothetical protein